MHKSWNLLDVERLTGIQLTESFAMGHSSSVSGLYFAHPNPVTSAWPQPVGRLCRA
jgi:cobalamin-dependent methionine synthase I